VSVTASKRLNSPLSAASRYRKELFLSLASFIIVSSILYALNSNPVIYIFTGSISLVFFYFYIGKKRYADLSEIKKTLRVIASREMELASSTELDKGLSDIQAELNEMINKINEDFIYLKKLEQTRREFLGNVSHELKTPIFAIGGYIETLLNGAIADPKVNMHFLQKAYDHTQNLSNLLNDLIDISLIESGQLKMSFRYFNLKNFLTELEEEFNPTISETPIQLVIHPVRKGLQIYGDKTRFRQVMINLLQNAVKYSSEGSIQIIVEENSDDCTIMVKDEGVGIQEDDLTRIFERFYRVDKARSRDVGGTGLGLAIVKHILEAHNSKIEVKSKYGEGSTFFFKLAK